MLDIKEAQLPGSPKVEVLNAVEDCTDEGYGNGEIS